MKVVFLIPPSVEKRNPDRLFGCSYAFFLQHNIFIVSSATYLRENEFNVEFVDCIMENRKIDEVLEKEADAYVFYSVFLSRKIDLGAADYIQKKFPRKTIIFMGPDPTVYPEKYCKEDRFVIRGEPEDTLLELCKVLRDKNKKHSNLIKIKGLTFFDGKKIKNNKPRELIEDLDKLPIPDRSLIKMPFKYYNPKFKKIPSTTMLTSRGCAFRCYFCIPNSLSFAREVEWKRFFKKKPPVTMRSPEKIIEEFKQIKKQGYNSVFIVDDQFVWGKERTLQIMRGIKHLDMEISILARCDMLIDEELVKEMKEAGVKFVDLGIESFNQEILDDIKKDLKVECIKKCVGNLKKFGIEPEVNIILGSSPLETKETIERTIEEVEKMDVEVVHATVCTPFPGTDFRKIAIEKGWTKDEEYKPIDPGADSLISYTHLPKEELIRAVKSVYRRHYFNPRYILKQVLKLKSFKELLNKSKTAFNIFKNIIISKNK